MGPIATPVAAQARPRALVLLVLSAATLMAFAVFRREARSADPPPPTIAIASSFDLDRIARAHRLWVADHGHGCARSVAHLLPYVPGASAVDPWGGAIALTCDRNREMGLVVRVESIGPDQIHGTADDLAATATN